ncbi:hypothetical protein U9M48_005101 [Paspalum notatum var. saurae]|uniref:Tetratricopeptide repeat (TPR)-like superfamily protein n=1 Tax=Paspalum notatum var. saurae TaxID=547442 RepID=A0AAQ3SF96_PASNO
MAAAYRRLLLLRRVPIPRLQPAAASQCLVPTAAAATALVKPSGPSAAELVETPLSTLWPGFAGDGNFKHSWHWKLGSSVGAVLIGQAAFLLGLSNSYASAQEDSVSPSATSEQTEANATGLQRIEDGSVVSNEHTAKWRIFTDNARDFFQKAMHAQCWKQWVYGFSFTLRDLLFSCDIALRYQKQFAEAENLFQAALLEAKEGFGLRDPHVASALNNLAEFYRLKKEYEKAELLYLEAIEILEESFGSDDISQGLPDCSSTSTIGPLDYKLITWSDQVISNESREGKQELQGGRERGQTCGVATALHSLGMCYHLHHKFAQAQTCYEIEGRVMGVGNPEYASTLYLLAKVLSIQGKRRAAESLAEESIRILEEAGLGESPTCIQRMKYLSTELIKSKQFAEAEIWQRKILHTLELSKAWHMSSTFMFCLFNIPSCGINIQHGVSLKHVECGWDSLHTIHTAEDLSLTLQALEKFKESEELLERSLAAKKKVLPEGHFLVAGTLVHLARLTLLKFACDVKNSNNNVATYYIVRAQQHCNDSIRITDGILNPSSTDQNKFKSTSATDGEKIAATVVLLQTLDVIGLTDITAKHAQAPWEQDYTSTEGALHKCISLYREPDTRRLVTKVVKQDYLRCLRALIEIVEDHFLTQQTMELHELLSEARQIIDELGGESNNQ